MSQFHADRFNIAWFKLAEFVARKEKERALGIYRLLVHSLPEEALAAQLEGDLLLAFNDEKAINSYVRAADLYEREGKLTKAIAIYEHCVTLLPNSIEHLTNLIKLYTRMEHASKVLHHVSALVKVLANKARYSEALSIVDELITHNDHKAHALELFISHVLCTIEYDETWLDKPMDFVLDVYMVHDDPKKLTSFLSTLSTLSDDAHTYAKHYIKNKI